MENIQPIPKEIVDMMCSLHEKIVEESYFNSIIGAFTRDKSAIESILRDYEYTLEFEQHTSLVYLLQQGERIDMPQVLEDIIRREYSKYF